MNEPIGSPPPSGGSHRVPPAHSLKKNTIGAFGLTFMVVAAAAPLTAMASNLSISLAFGVGRGTVGLLIVVGILLGIFAIAFVTMAAHVKNAGAYYAMIGHGFGRRTGAASAMVATVAYNMAAAGMAAATGYFASVTIAAAGGPNLPWYTLALCTLAATWYLGRRGVEVTQHFTTGISLLQFAMIFLLGAVIAIQRPDQWSLEVVTPSAMFDGNIALTLVFCVLSFVGFEATAIYGEEAKSARRSIRLATFASVAILVGVFAFSTWSITAAYTDVRAEAAADPGTLIFRTADIYLGTWSGTVLSALVTVSFFAAGVAFHNMAARYHFSLARDGILPSGLSCIHPRWSTPSAGSSAQTVVSIIVLLPFVIFSADPILNLFPIVSGITSLSLISLMVACSASVVASSLRGHLSESRWSTLAAPLTAGICLTGIAVIIAINYAEVTGSTSPLVMASPLLPIIAAIVGAVRGGERDSDAAGDDPATHPEKVVGKRVQP
ncbi:APC family permease [Brevibacterium sp. FAM 25378]|uniref:APC family permease n=1 Tax=unclassified Brevibacterium TaxID=2614124 RepID=UPI0010929416|nr:APC family permease [Brevibacterium sp. S22]TGD32114.1 APC family permease [Brevibacterium sp. S22]